MDLTRDQFTTLSEKFFGGRHPVAWERVTEGVSTVVYRARRREERFYLRILPELGLTFAPEVKVHERARALGCRVPEVLAYEVRNPVLERSLMLTREIPGRPIGPEIDRVVAREVLNEAGRDLARINSISVGGFGWVKRQSGDVNDPLSAAHQSFGSLIESEYRPALASLPDDAVPGIQFDRIVAALDDAIALLGSNAPARLAHGDFDTSHIFVQEDQYSGIIDFGEIRGMPWFYDLAHHRMHDRERLPFSTLKWLIQGYRDITSVPVDIDDQLSAMSLLIATRALQRGLRHAKDGQIIRTARRAIRRELEHISL